MIYNKIIINLCNFNSINQHVPDGLHDNIPWQTKHFPLSWHLSLICFPKQSEIETGVGGGLTTGSYLNTFGVFYYGCVFNYFEGFYFF